jgi:hypothetical protein
MSILAKPLSRGILSLTLFFTLAMFCTLAHAQFLVGVELASATALTLDSSVQLPSGSYRAVGPEVAQLVAKEVPDASHYSGWEAYEANGLIARLQPVFVEQLATSFAVAGYLQEDKQKTKQGKQTKTRYLFSNGAGATIVLYVLRSPEQLVWLVGQQQ